MNYRSAPPMLPPGIAPERERIFHEYQGLVKTIAWLVHQKVRTRVDLDDLIAYGAIGLLQSIDRFEVGPDRKFVTYAWHRIRGAVLDGLATMAWFNRADYERGVYAEMTTPPGDPAMTSIQSTAPPAPVIAARRELETILQTAIGALPEREQILLRATFFGHQTLTDAARSLGIGTAWASRLQRRSLATLRTVLAEAGFGV